MQESTVTVKGQSTLPRDLRAALGLTSGDRLRYIIMDGEVRILKARPVRDLRGALVRPGQRPVSLDDMDDAICAAATDHGTPDR